MSAVQNVESQRGWLLGVASVLLVASTAARSVTPEPPTDGGPTAFRRMNEVQYRRSIEDIFGAAINIPGRFEPPLRDGGLLAIGDAKVVVTSSGLEQYELRAREISAQVLAEDKRKHILTCTPASPKAFDRSCAAQFIGKYGRLLFRRPLTDNELASALGVVRMANERTGDFYKGLEAGLARLLVSPYFIFRVESSEPSPENKNSENKKLRRLDAYSLATRISFLFWDAPPDAELLNAAASGELRKDKGLERQIDRLIASPRYEQGVRSFFSDMLAYDQFEGLSKDQAIFPKFTSQLSKDAKEQTLRTIVDLLVTNRGDYRDLFTTKKTFVNRSLGSLYKVPVDEAGFDGWAPYTFGPDDSRAGLLTFAAFLMLDPSHEGRSSPTIRGKTVRELLLCQKIPPPPPDINFDLVQDTGNALYKTARSRLTAHRDKPACAGCHTLTDPIGLAMENYDAVGEYRAHENGTIIDASGAFDGASYTNLIELQNILRASPTVSNCVAERVYEYGIGRSATAKERDWIAYLGGRFADAHYVFPSLMRQVATSKAFQAVSANTPAST